MVRSELDQECSALKPHLFLLYHAIPYEEWSQEVGLQACSRKRSDPEGACMQKGSGWGGSLCAEPTAAGGRELYLESSSHLDGKTVGIQGLVGSRN